MCAHLIKFSADVELNILGALLYNCSGIFWIPFSEQYIPNCSEIYTPFSTFLLSLFALYKYKIYKQVFICYMYLLLYVSLRMYILYVIFYMNIYYFCNYCFIWNLFSFTFSSLFVRKYGPENFFCTIHSSKLFWVHPCFSPDYKIVILIS